MLPIHAFLADVSCPPGVTADDRFAEVGGLFIGWVEGAFTEESPEFVLPDGGTVEPAQGHVIGVQSDCCAQASTLVGEACLAIQHRMTAADVASTVHAYPTASELFRWACAQLA